MACLVLNNILGFSPKICVFKSLFAIILRNRNHVSGLFIAGRKKLLENKQEMFQVYELFLYYLHLFSKTDRHFQVTGNLKYLSMRIETLCFT